MAKEIRRQIVNRKFAPGEKLPNREEMRQHFGSTAATIQRAFDQLQAEGFVVAKGRAGTFVADFPPHLCHYGLVLSEHSGSLVRPYMWLVLEAQAMELARKAGPMRRFSVFHMPSNAASISHYHALTELIQNDGLAGLIFASLPHTMEGSVVLDHPGIPRVVISSVPEYGECGLIRLHGQLSLALDYLKSRGRRRIALLVSPVFQGLDRFAELLAERGMTTEARWQQAIHYSTEPRLVYNVVRLILHGKVDDRPDGLIIADDNVVEAATRGILESGVNVPQDMDVVAHANFPLPTPSMVPAKRIGFDMRQILSSGIGWIDAARRGDRPPKSMDIGAISDDQVV